MVSAAPPALAPNLFVLFSGLLPWLSLSEDNLLTPVREFRRTSTIISESVTDMFPSRSTPYVSKPPASSSTKSSGSASEVIGDLFSRPPNNKVVSPTPSISVTHDAIPPVINCPNRPLTPRPTLQVSTPVLDPDLKREMGSVPVLAVHGFIFRSTKIFVPKGRIAVIRLTEKDVIKIFNSQDFELAVITADDHVNYKKHQHNITYHHDRIVFRSGEHSIKGPETFSATVEKALHPTPTIR